MKQSLRIALLAIAAMGMQAPAQQAALLDINTATTAQLIALPGMGEAYARRVVAARPYTAKNQLVTRGVLPQATYERIKDRIIAHRPKVAPPAIAPQQTN